MVALERLARSEGRSVILPLIPPPGPTVEQLKLWFVIGRIDLDELERWLPDAIRREDDRELALRALDDFR